MEWKISFQTKKNYKLNMKGEKMKKKKNKEKSLWIKEKKKEKKKKIEDTHNN